ncbi:MAG: GGDEF domain-containing protein [Vampirovibrionales bacterium]
MLPLYAEGMRGIVDFVYALTNGLVVPGYMISKFVIGLSPGLETAYFPEVKANVLLIPLPEYLRSTLPLHGVLEWNTLIAIVFYTVLSPLLQHAYLLLKSFVFMIVTEFLFTQKKEATYRGLLKGKNQQVGQLLHQEQNLQTQVQELSNTVIKDPLTQTYNRRFFTDKIRDTFTEHKQKRQVLSVMMVDIDYFKKINDTFGHLVGDEVLTAVSSLLMEFVGSAGFCCRYGGEEFCVILPLLSKHRAEQLGEQIRDQVTKLIFREHMELVVSVSIGIATVDFMHNEALSQVHHQEDLIKLADDQLYLAKTNGRNRVRITQI